MAEAEDVEAAEVAVEAVVEVREAAEAAAAAEVDVGAEAEVRRTIIAQHHHQRNVLLIPSDDRPRTKLSNAACITNICGLMLLRDAQRAMDRGETKGGNTIVARV